MVNEHPERALALSYAPADRRSALGTLLALDDRLGQIARSGREPLLAQMRLTWWHEALRTLDQKPAPAEPLLRALAQQVLPRGVSGGRLAALVEGWEALLDGEGVAVGAAARGRCLFELAGELLGAAVVEAAGEGWALAEQASRTDDPAAHAAIRADAVGALRGAAGARWPVRARALGALALSARFDADGRLPPGHPLRVARLAWHRATGR